MFLRLCRLDLKLTVRVGFQYREMFRGLVVVKGKPRQVCVLS